jgi:hypothetical protein
MLTVNQLAEIEKAMEEEHRQDREALQRLKRFLKNGANGRSGASPRLIDTHQYDDGDGNAQTIIGTVDSAMQADHNRKWTVPLMLAYLRDSNFPLAAQKPEATLGLIFKKLQRRGRIRLVKRGSGRLPNVYKAVQPTAQEGESDLESERAAS